MPRDERHRCVAVLVRTRCVWCQVPCAHLRPHLGLLLLEPLLLVADDGARSADAEPGHGLHGCPPPVFHDVATNQRTCPAETCFAVNSDGAFLALADVKELLQDGVWRCGAVNEKQVLVVEARIGEPLAVVDLLVESDNASDVVESEVRKVGFGRVQWVAVLYLGLSVRAAKSQKFLRNEPVKVSVLNLLIVFVLVVVEVIEVEEPRFIGFVHSFEAVQDCDGVHRDTKTCITEWNKGRIKSPNQRFKCFLWSFVEINDAVGRDKKCSIGSLVAVQGGVVNNLLLGQGVRFQLPVEFIAVPTRILSVAISP